MTSWDAVEQLGIGYERLKSWWQRGIVRSWGQGRYRLVSRAEVKRELARRDGVRHIKRKPYFGDVSEVLTASGDPDAPPPPRRPSVPLTLPELPERPSLPQQGPWGYTVE